MKENYFVDERGFYGEFGGAYVPEILYKCVHDLQEAYLPIIESAEFKAEYHALLKDYVGRPSPLYFAKRMSEHYGCQLYLKREDLNHTGAHKINNTIGQILLAKKMGKTRIIAETGAGQHGVATATVCALMNMKCEVFMGATDVERQHTNVERMKMLGAEVHPVRTGNMTLSDACSEAIRDWCCHPADTFYIVGSTMGPHPYPGQDAECDFRRDQVAVGGEDRARLPRLPHRLYRRRFECRRHHLPLCKRRTRKDRSGRSRRTWLGDQPHSSHHPQGHNRHPAWCQDAGDAERGRTD